MATIMEVYYKSMTDYIGSFFQLKKKIPELEVNENLTNLFDHGNYIMYLNVLYMYT